MLLGAYVVQSGGTVSGQAVVASLPIAILVALILYVNEIPIVAATHGWQADAPRALSKAAVISGYRPAALPPTRSWLRESSLSSSATGAPRPSDRAAGPPGLARPRPNYDNPYGLDGGHGFNIGTCMRAFC